MKKTLTVNLGGTVFHIDEDAYQLLDKYLTNLRVHFRKEDDSEEIMNDFEMRISELFSERIRLGYTVISIIQVKEVIERMGEPEEIFGDDFKEEYHRENVQPPEPPKMDTSSSSSSRTTYEVHTKRFFRNPDDRILGGVASGFAAYMGWDPTMVRLVLFILIFFTGFPLVLYFVLWLIVPVAKTATEKLQMRGESVTVENIGKTVTDSFERVSSSVNDYISSDKPRNALQKIADFFIDVIGVCIKIAMVLAGIVLVPVLLLVIFVLVVVVFALIFGGGAAAIGSMVPMFNMHPIGGYPDALLTLTSVCTIFILGIPLVSALYSLCSQIFKFQPVNSGVKWTILIIWFIAVGINLYLFSRYGFPFMYHWDSLYLW